MKNELKKVFNNYSPLIKTAIFIIAIYLLPGLVYLSWVFIAAILLPYFKNDQKRNQVILALTILGLFNLLITSMTPTCYSISNAEKGITPEEILKCRLLSLYIPTGARISGTFSAIPVIINIFQSLASVLIAIIGVVVFLIYGDKKKK